jgi:hypothetical protein
MKVSLYETYNTINHVQDLRLDKLKSTGITSRRTANNVVDLDVIVLPTNTTPVHGVRELDKHRVLLHYSLNVLPSDANDSLMVLVRNMEGNRCRHLLLNERKSRFHRIIFSGTDIDVKVILVEAVKYNLHATYKTISIHDIEVFWSRLTLSHDLINLAVFLATNKFLMLIREFNLDAYLILRM